jgi:hypothetical protein
MNFHGFIDAQAINGQDIDIFYYRLVFYFLRFGRNADLNFKSGNYRYAK